MVQIQRAVRTARGGKSGGYSGWGYSGLQWLQYPGEASTGGAPTKGKRSQRSWLVRVLTRAEVGRLERSMQTEGSWVSSECTPRAGPPALDSMHLQSSDE